MEDNEIDPAVNHRDVEQLDYTVPRLTLPIPAVREFQKRYETAVPDLPLAAVTDLVSRTAPWSDMVELIERSAPHGFLIYFRNEVHPVMALAGERADCVAYLMGNHIFAERMFRHDPRALMYRAAAHRDLGGPRRQSMVHRRSAQRPIWELRDPRGNRSGNRARPQAGGAAGGAGRARSRRAEVTIRSSNYDIASSCEATSRCGNSLDRSSSRSTALRSTQPPHAAR